MHFARILYASVVTDTGRYLVGSVLWPFSLYSGDSVALSIVSVSLSHSWVVLRLIYEGRREGRGASLWTPARRLEL